jgi:hypothetical protein
VGYRETDHEGGEGDKEGFDSGFEAGDEAVMD